MPRRSVCLQSEKSVSQSIARRADPAHKLRALSTALYIRVCKKSIITSIAIETAAFLGIARLTFPIMLGSHKSLALLPLCLSFVGNVQSCFYSEPSDAAAITIDLNLTALQNNKARDLNPPPWRKIALTNVRVFDGYQILDPSTVVIHGSHIGHDTEGAEVVDGQGGVLLPGLIDSHCHPANLTHLEDLTRFGVTTGILAVCPSPQLCASLRNHTGLTDFRQASNFAAAPNSTHGNLPGVNQSLLISSPAQAVPWVDYEVAQNPDFTKLIAETPGLDQQTLNALTLRAHEHGKLTICHAAAYHAIAQALTAGADQIHHTPYDKALDEPLVSQFVNQKRISTPTLTIIQTITNKVVHNASRYEFAKDSVTALYNACVPILAGTDANVTPGIVASLPFGSSLHLELELLVQAGMSTVDALRAATSLPAKYFGLHDRGVIEPGRRADLVLISGDPIKNISATRSLRRVWLAGVEYSGSLGTDSA